MGFLENIRGPELIVILVIVVILFGSGRIGKIGGEIGSAIKNFRQGIQDEDTSKEKKPAEPAAVDQTAGQSGEEKKTD
jgi:sec-independent protein translocase protein TatA